MLVIIACFYVLSHRVDRFPFARNDYANYSQRGRPKIYSREVYREKIDRSRNHVPRIRASLAVVSIAILVAAAVFSIVPNVLDILLFLVFLSPFFFGLLRVRSHERKEQRRPDDDTRAA
jgi:fatty acid desaturase